MVASSNKRLKKITKLSEISLKDFTDKAQNEVLNWFSMTPAHWVMLHRVMISFFKRIKIGNFWIFVSNCLSIGY